ncbi:MAG TPA: transposase [Terriglobia bacterium]|nr:transposase [Terriglobia bacterium]
MENQEKKPYTAEEKVAILRRHLNEKVTVPDPCDEYHLHPSVFYRWLKQFFDNGTAAFAPTERPSRREEAQRQRIEALEAKLRRKDEVLAELMEEHVALKKKSWGELKGRSGP